MAQFMLLLRGGGSMPEHFTPEQVQQALQMYFDWSDKLRGEGRMRGGDQLGGGRTVRMQGEQAVVDGPYAETKEAIGGYFLIDAASVNEAAEIAKGCPVLRHGGLVDVREIVAMSKLIEPPRRIERQEKSSCFLLSTSLASWWFIPIEASYAG